MNYTAPMSERPQFYANDQSLDRVARDPRVVPITDGRSLSDPPRLAREGLELFDWPTGVKEFRDVDDVARLYPEEIRQFVLELTGADVVAVTGPPILRFGERSPEAGTRDNSRAARLVHIDVSDSAAADFARMAAPTGERKFRRVAQHNIWRAISNPPQDVPLAVCNARTVAAVRRRAGGCEIRSKRQGRLVLRGTAAPLQPGPSLVLFLGHDPQRRTRLQAA